MGARAGGSHHWIHRAAVAMMLWLAASSAFAIAWLEAKRDSAAPTSAEERTMPSALPRPLAVLGDSDSAGYQDRISLPDEAARGGDYRERTLQWTEVLAKLRGDVLDLGPRVETGGEGALDATWSKINGRSPRTHKLDHLHNFALSGWGCDSLLDSHRAQVTAFVELIEADPERWARGAVVIRIGVNDFGQREALHALAADPADVEVNARIDGCIDAIGRSLAALREAAPELLVVLVGIFDNSHWVPLQNQFQSRAELDNIGQALDRFDTALRAMADADSRAVFFDERAWFATHFGGRSARGRPAYRSVRIGKARLRNSQGDAPGNAIVADGHAGTGWNALWASDLVAVIARELPEPALRTLQPEEIQDLLRP
jgi:hypothetical protein